MAKQALDDVCPQCGEKIDVLPASTRSEINGTFCTFTVGIRIYNDSTAETVSEVTALRGGGRYFI